MWYYDRELDTNFGFPSLEKVQSIGPESLTGEQYLSDPINTFACVRVIVSSSNGVRIDHVNIESDLEVYLTEFMTSYSPNNTHIVVSGGSEAWTKSRVLVTDLIGFFRGKGFCLPDANIDVFGNVEREIHVFQDRVEVYVNKVLYKTINFI
ncbi:MAG: hypothetical protein JNK26_05020 [Candidatus Doudnabacteria bacterium]|nr:hypothetical protein [Candidatus Doudnabacteria bacterium]